MDDNPLIWLPIESRATKAQRRAIYRLYSPDVIRHLTESEAQDVIGILVRAVVRMANGQTDVNDDPSCRCTRAAIISWNVEGIHEQDR
jgi:hypothetical protein